MKKRDISGMGIEELRMIDLKKTYKYVKNCKVCGKQYGSDAINDNGICPRCSFYPNGKSSFNKSQPVATASEQLDFGQS